jgi:hypothetical protein
MNHKKLNMSHENSCYIQTLKNLNLPQKRSPLVEHKNIFNVTQPNPLTSTNSQKSCAATALKNFFKKQAGTEAKSQAKAKGVNKSHYLTNRNEEFCSLTQRDIKNSLRFEEGIINLSRTNTICKSTKENMQPTAIRTPKICSIQEAAKAATARSKVRVAAQMQDMAIPLKIGKLISIPNNEPSKCSNKSNGIVKAYAANTNQGIVR